MRLVNSRRPPATAMMLPFMLALLLTGGASAGAQSATTSNELAAVQADPQAMEMQAAVLNKQDLKEIQRILKSGFNINAPIGCGTFNSVDGAVAVGNVKILKYLLANGAEPKGWALYQAAWHRNPEMSFQMVEALLKAGADAGYKQPWPTYNITGDTRLPATNRFETPLHVACYLSNASVVELLLKQPGVDLDGLNIDGYTPLMNAARKGNGKIIMLLLEKGANPKVMNGRRETAMDFARKQSGIELKVLQALERATTGTKAVTAIQGALHPKP